jgi:5,5'-dehydrodivanillate O-demethylase
LHIPTFNEQARFPGPRFRPTYLIHTPVDDENHLVFITQVVPVTGTEAEEYNKRYRELLEGHKRQPLPMEIADQVFGGDKSLDDIKDYHLLVGVEDLLTQVGQGAMVDRSDERLGRSDAGVVLLRRLWARELEALRKGRPSKQWAFMTNPPEGLSAEPFLNPSGIAQAGESSGTPTSAGRY